MRKSTLTTFLFIGLAIALQSRAFGEYWREFSEFIEEVNYVAQRQSLVRGDKVIGTRIVKVYWRSKDFDEKRAGVPQAKEWSFREYDRKTDKLHTTFEFYSRASILWEAGPINGAILYPGTTTDGDPGSEVACSISEFHDLLLQIAVLRTEGKRITRQLLPRFGASKTSKP